MYPSGRELRKTLIEMIHKECLDKTMGQHWERWWRWRCRWRFGLGKVGDGPEKKTFKSKDNKVRVSPRKDQWERG